MERAFVCEGRGGKLRRGTADYATKARLVVYVASIEDIKGDGHEVLAHNGLWTQLPGQGHKWRWAMRTEK